MRALLMGIALAVVACSTTSTVGCGHNKPTPVVPAGEASCDQACANVSALPECGTSSELCLRICRGIAMHNPKYATCVYHARTCIESRACGGQDNDEPAVNGPGGGGRTGPLTL